MRIEKNFRDIKAMFMYISCCVHPSNNNNNNNINNTNTPKKKHASQPPQQAKFSLSSFIGVRSSEHAKQTFQSQMSIVCQPLRYSGNKTLRDDLFLFCLFLSLGFVFGFAILRASLFPSGTSRLLVYL